MTPRETAASDTSDKIADSAKGYFETLHKLQYAFWKLPNLTPLAKVMTGGFAIALIGLARWQMGQNVVAENLALSIALTLFFVLLICGLLLFCDRSRVDGDYLKLVSVVCGGVSLSCGLIVLDRLVPWIGPMWELERLRSLSSTAANLLVAAVAAGVAGFLLWLNTVFQVGPHFVESLGKYFRDVRLMLWTVAIWATIFAGVWIVIRKSDIL